MLLILGFLEIIMKKKWSIGLMTGTANDGNIDIAALQTDGDKIINFGPFELLSYEDKEIKDLIFLTYQEARKWSFLGAEPKIFSITEKKITQEQSKAVQEFIHKNKLNKDDISCIGFHGLTILHQPVTSTNASKQTRQLGDGQMMADYLQLPVVNDFRTNDIIHGGQGAPLAPIYHLALAKNINEKNIVFLNIGGVSNITYVGDKDELIALDCGPGNAPIDDFVRYHNKGLMDTDGGFAKLGTVNYDLVNAFMENNYFNLPYPKSLDRNNFNFDNIYKLSLEDGCATMAKIVAVSISKALQLLPRKPSKILSSGGGRKNITIMNEVSLETKIDCKNIEEYGLRGDAIEAEAFAFLAVRSLKKLPLSFPSTTGVKYPVSGGVTARNHDTLNT
jgi:anhydro-N-acetylmuramic acid kinase